MFRIATPGRFITLVPMGTPMGVPMFLWGYGPATYKGHFDTYLLCNSD